MTIQEMFKEGIGLRNNGQFDKAIAQFLFIIEEYPRDPKIAGVYSTLAGIYSDLGDHARARVYFTKASELNPQSELASLGLYVSLVELGRDEDAIMELKRYLKDNSANLYRTTLLELIEGLEQGYMASHKDLIMTLAQKNGLLNG